MGNRDGSVSYILRPGFLPSPSHFFLLVSMFLTVCICLQMCILSLGIFFPPEKGYRGECERFLGPPPLWTNLNFAEFSSIHLKTWVWKVTFQVPPLSRQLGEHPREWLSVTEDVLGLLGSLNVPALFLSPSFKYNWDLWWYILLALCGSMTQWSIVYNV